MFYFQETENIIQGITPKRKCVECIERYTEHNAIRIAPKEE